MSCNKCSAHPVHSTLLEVELDIVPERGHYPISMFNLHPCGALRFSAHIPPKDAFPEDKDQTILNQRLSSWYRLIRFGLRLKDLLMTAL